MADRFCEPVCRTYDRVHELVTYCMIGRQGGHGPPGAPGNAGADGSPGTPGAAGAQGM